MKLFSNNVMMGLKKDLDYRSMRQDLLTSNLANVDTPGFRPVDIDFSQQLREVLQADESKLSSTTSGHISGGEASTSGDPEIVAQETEDGLDGNGVNLDKQMAELSDNSLRYRTSVKIVNKKLALLKYVINDVR